VEQFDYWHIDPDRRATGRRSVAWQGMQPGLAALHNLLQRAPHAALKLAPATAATDWPVPTRREWIGHRRECQQQVIWTGKLAEGPPRQATLLDSIGRPHSLAGTGSVRAEQVDSCGRYVYEPHAVVLAAGLVGELAERAGLATFADDQAYLTSAGVVNWPHLHAFEVIDVLPLRLKTIRRHLAARQWSIDEIKCRAVKLDVALLRQRLRLRDGEPYTLVVVRQRRQLRALISRRLRREDPSS
jgi:hypothetical protein